MDIVKSAKDAAHVVLSHYRKYAKDRALWHRVPDAYRQAAQQPVDMRKVMLVETKEHDMPDAFKYLKSYLENHYDLDVSYHTLDQNKVSNGQYWRNCVELAREVATARCVFICDASDMISCLPLREETKVVQLWHGCGAFKKWGMSTADLVFGGSRESKKRHPFYENLDMVTISSPEVRWAYAEAMDIPDDPEVIQAIGVSSTDALFDETFLSSSRATLEKLVPQAKGKKVVFYAPTFRGRAKYAKGPDALDFGLLKQAMTDEWVIVVKHHPFVHDVPPIPDECRDFVFDLSGKAETDVLLAASNAYILDYSSLVFECSLFDRPMVFFAYDIDEYNDWRGFYYDYDEMTPGPVVSESQAVADYFAGLPDTFDSAQVRHFRDRFMSACDGHSTQRICRAVLGS